MKSLVNISISIAILAAFFLVSCQSPIQNNKEKAISELIHRGYKSDSLEDYHLSIRIYDSVLEREPDNIIALINRGRAKVYVGDTLSGLADLDASIKIQPTSEAFLSKATVEFMSSNPSQGLSSLRTGRNLFPDQHSFIVFLATYYTEIHPVKDSALYYADYALQLPLSKPIYYSALMNAYLEFGGDTKLIRVTDSLIAHFPDSPYPYNNRGLAKLNRGEISAAKEDIRFSLDRDSTNAWAYRNMGLAFRKIQIWDSACYYFRRARQKDSANEYKRDIDSLLRLCEKE